MKDGFLIGFLRPGQCQQVPSSRPIHQQSHPISGRVCVCVCVCVCVVSPKRWSALNAQMRGYYPSWNKWATASFPSCECCLAGRLSEPRRRAISLHMAENTHTHTE